MDWGEGSGGGAGGRAAELDREFERSLEAFDGVILSEQEALARAGGAGGAADAASRTGVGAGTGEGGGEGDGRPRVVSGNVNVFGEDDGQWEDGPSSGGAIAGGRPTERPTDEEMAERIPDDVGDGRDDDIVARQLREAAMNEPDPELRERLWEEYRDYRESIGR